MKTSVSSDRFANLEVGVEPVTVGFGGGSASSKMAEQEDIVDLKTVEPGYLRIEAGGKMFIPYAENKESFLSIWVFKC